MAAHPELARASSGYSGGVARMIRAWQGDVLELVAEEGRGKRQTARIAATGVNGVGAALMLVIFASTGGITGAEWGVAGGTTVLAQKLLESIFGDDAVRRLAKTAKTALDGRIEAMLAAELDRYTAVTDALQVSRTLPGELTDACEAVRRARLERPVLGQGPLTPELESGRVHDGTWFAGWDPGGVEYSHTIALPPAGGEASPQGEGGL